MGDSRVGAHGHVRPARHRRQFNPFFLEPAAIDQMRAALSARIQPQAVNSQASRDLALASMLMLAGLRSNEARMLDLDDVRFAEQELHVRFGKGHKRRTLPLYDDLAEAITQWLAVRPEPRPGHEAALFLTQQRRRIANRTIRDDAKRWARAAGISLEFHPHSGRHSSVVRQRRAGVAIEAVRDYHGHSSIAITDLYSHLSAADLRDEVAKVNRRS